MKLTSIFWNGWGLEGDAVLFRGKPRFSRDELDDPAKVAAVLCGIYDNAGRLDEVTGFISLLHQVGALRAWRE